MNCCVVTVVLSLCSCAVPVVAQRDGTDAGLASASTLGAAASATANPPPASTAGATHGTYGYGTSAQGASTATAAASKPVASAASSYYTPPAPPPPQSFGTASYGTAASGAATASARAAVPASVSVGAAADTQSKEEINKELHRAAGEGDLAAVEAALAAGGDPNHIGSHGWTPLHMVGVHKSQNSEKIAAALIAKRGDVDKKDGIGRTPLFFAAMEGLTSTVKDMLMVAKDLHASGPGGPGAIGNAAQAGRHDVVKLLIDARADTSASKKMVHHEADHEMRRLYGILPDPAPATGYASRAANSAYSSVKTPTEL